MAEHQHIVGGHHHHEIVSQADIDRVNHLTA